MTSDSFLVYKRFDSSSKLNEITAVLVDNQIPYIVENDTPHFDPRITTPINTELLLKIKGKDFVKVNQLLLSNVEFSKNEIPTDYYLYSFTNEELINILKKQDEWGTIDLALTKEILIKRGMVVTDDQLNDFRKQRIKELSNPDDPSFYWILVGYGFALLGGIIGMLWGFFLMTHKKTLPNGKIVQGYSVGYQKHGFFILLLGILMTIILIGARFA